MFAFEHRPGARRAANGREALTVQRIGGDTVGVDVRLKLGVCPVDDRIEFDEAGHAISLETWEGGAVVALGCTQPGDPNRSTLERPLERIDFANPATRLPRASMLLKMDDMPCSFTNASNDMVSGK